MRLLSQRKGRQNCRSGVVKATWSIQSYSPSCYMNWLDNLLLLLKADIRVDFGRKFGMWNSPFSALAPVSVARLLIWKNSVSFIYIVPCHYIPSDLFIILCQMSLLPLGIYGVIQTQMEKCRHRETASICKNPKHFFNPDHFSLSSWISQ